MTQQEKARLFRGMHVPTLVLPNAWDPASAKLIAHVGARAIATGSAAVAWAHGKRDGQLTRQESVDAIRRIASAVTLPVTADIESGYDDVAATVRAVLEAGVVGVNLEDSPGPDGAAPVAASEHCARIQQAIAVARSMECDIVINARTDVFLNEVGPAGERLAHAIERGRQYVAAGADCVFVPGVADEATISALVKGIAAPLNIVLRPSSPSIARLKELGVARVSAGPRIAEVAHAATLAATREILEHGTYSCLQHGLSFDSMERMMQPEPPPQPA